MMAWSKSFLPRVPSSARGTKSDITLRYWKSFHGHFSGTFCGGKDVQSPTQSVRPMPLEAKLHVQSSGAEIGSFLGDVINELFPVFFSNIARSVECDKSSGG